MHVLQRIIDGIRHRTDWGINLGQVRCPRCGARQPRLRLPRTERQRLWGGWTCKACGCEMDKWGRDLSG